MKSAFIYLVVVFNSQLLYQADFKWIEETQVAPHTSVCMSFSVNKLGMSQKLTLSFLMLGIISTELKY